MTRMLTALLLILALAANAQALCPNGRIEPPETCDDGNTVAGDGCSPLCLLEAPNLPPVCDNAAPTVESLWPPNHKLVSVGIDGVADPDGDAVAVTITAIAQDEPVDGEGSGSTCVDAAGVGTDVASVRSERDGSGDGRVYHIAFRARDPFGAECLGAVEVCVRHDNGHGGFCGDQGPAFDSTVGVCRHGDDCHLDDCVPEPPVVVAACEHDRLPPRFRRRLERTRHLLVRAATAGPQRAQFLLRVARLRLARLDAAIARRLDGDCQIELHDIMTHALRCTACASDD